MNSPVFSLEEYRYILRHAPASFIERSFRELNAQATFMPSPYIELLASHLGRCRTGEAKRLIINLPPRSLKSHAASVAFPARLLGHDPTKQIICASYGQDLADKHARDCRALMGSAIYRSLFPKTVLSPERSAVNDFSTTRQGFRMATSVGGVLTDRGADVIILDDILKPDDALSELRRKAANEWFFNTLLSRLNRKQDGVIIIVMQRLHQEDLVAEVMEREPWEVLALPAIAVKDEALPYERMDCPLMYTRKEGRALHPERESIETLKRVRESIGSYNFQSQYQQDPAALEGGLIKREWIHHYEPFALQLARWPYILQSWDTASKSSEMNDYSVCTTWQIIDGKLYLLDVFRQRLEFPSLKRAVLELQQRYQPMKVLIEDRASGTALIQALNSEYVYGIEAYTPPAGSDKYMRFAAQALHFESGRVLLPKEAPWLEDYIREITVSRGRSTTIKWIRHHRFWPVAAQCSYDSHQAPDIPENQRPGTTPPDRMGCCPTFQIAES